MADTPMLALEQRAAEVGEQLPLPVEQTVMLLDTLMSGLVLRRLIYSEDLVPDELFANALRLILAGSASTPDRRLRPGRRPKK
jgi:hypothetical protein